MRVRQNWTSRFGSWVRHYGASRLATDLGQAVYGQPLRRSAVYHWIEGRAAPRARLALGIVTLARGRLTLADIYAHPFRRAEAFARGCPHVGGESAARVPGALAKP